MKIDYGVLAGLRSLEYSPVPSVTLRTGARMVSYNARSMAIASYQHQTLGRRGYELTSNAIRRLDYWETHLNDAASLGELRRQRSVIEPPPMCHRCGQPLRGHGRHCLI